MAIFDVSGEPLADVYGVSGDTLNIAYDIAGNPVFSPNPDYSNYSYTLVWASKGIRYTQGFDIYDGMVFWVSKSGDSTIPADCYVFYLSNGATVFNDPITIYSGHGNNISIDYPKLYAAPAYAPPRVFINTLDGYTATLDKTLLLDDGSLDCDACLDENDKTILWSLGHTNNSSDRQAPFYISKWNLNNLTDNGDGTFTPELLQTRITPQPESSFFIQGTRMHDGILWFACGYGGGNTNAYVYGLDPDTGTRVYTIDLNTTEEPEGVAWVKDDAAIGGYALYVGFQGMMLRKYTFKGVS